MRSPGMPGPFLPDTREYEVGGSPQELSAADLREYRRVAHPGTVYRRVWIRPGASALSPGTNGWGYLSEDQSTFMGRTIRLDLTAILEATGELKHFLDLGSACLKAERPPSQEASEALIFALADELEGHLRAMRDAQGSATIDDLRVWIQAWIEERREAFLEEATQK